MLKTTGWMLCLSALLPGCLFDNSARIERERQRAERETREMDAQDELRSLREGQASLERALAQERAERESLRRELDALRTPPPAPKVEPAVVRPAAPKPVLTAEEASVTQIQGALKRAGYDPGPTDGKMGQKTKSALMAFQKDNGLKADGVLGPQTLAKLQKHLSAPEAP